MTREEALALVREYVKNEGLVRHMLSVEAAMRFYAEKFGEDPEMWGLIGLLHDFDWEIHPTLDQHPQDGAPMLRERGVFHLRRRALQQRSQAFAIEIGRRLQAAQVGQRRIDVEQLDQRHRRFAVQRS